MKNPEYDKGIRADKQIGDYEASLLTKYPNMFDDFDDNSDEKAFLKHIKGKIEPKEWKKLSGLYNKANTYSNKYSYAQYVNQLEDAIEANPVEAAQSLPEGSDIQKEAVQAIDGGKDAEVNNNVVNEFVEENLDDLIGQEDLNLEPTTKDFNKPGTISNDEFVDKYYKPFNDDGFNGEMSEDIPYAMENTPILRGNHGLMNPQPVWDKPATDLPALRSANLPADVYDSVTLPKEAPKDINVNPKWDPMTQSSGSPAGDIPVTAQPQATPKAINTGMIGSSFGLPHMSTSVPSPVSISSSTLPNVPVSTARKSSGVGVKNTQTTTKQVATANNAATLKHNNGSAGIESGKVSKGGSLGFHANKLPNGGGHTADTSISVDIEDLKNTMIEALKKRILMAPDQKRKKYGIEIKYHNVIYNGAPLQDQPMEVLYQLNKLF